MCSNAGDDLTIHGLNLGLSSSPAIPEELPLNSFPAAKAELLPSLPATVPTAELRPSPAQLLRFQTFSSSCADNKACPSGSQPLPQYFNSHTNTPTLLANCASLGGGSACVIRPWGSTGPSPEPGASRNKGIKWALVQQSHCQPRGASHQRPPQGFPPRPNCGVNECTCSTFLDPL